VSTVALPLVGIGALLRLVTRGRRARLLLAISGFGLVFVGIDVMQSGMGELDLDLTPEGGPGGIGTTLALVAAGIAMTVVMQSSSAAVTTTLVALHAGSITLEQAAALVIGQNVGTTVTAILGAIGGNIGARRAAVAHTMFNVGTGALALLVLGPFLELVQSLGTRFVDDSPESAVALFHTAFNVLGVAIFFPFTTQFAAAIERIVPERKVPAVERLSPGALQMPAMALEAARKSAIQVGLEVVRLGVESLRSAARRDDEEPVWRRALALLGDPRAILAGADEATRELADRLRRAERATSALVEYLGRIRTGAQPPDLRDEHVELLHAVDHLGRLVRVVEREEELEVVAGDAELQRLAAAVADELAPGLASATDDPAHAPELAAAFDVAARAESQRRDEYRSSILALLADGSLLPTDADRLLKASRWVGKIPKHAHRILLHLGWTAGTAPIVEPDEP
jgi:phosphate:Na+ symporter